MRIAKKDIERLTYVERALETKENHLAKVVHNVLQELNPEFVYVVAEEGSEFTSHTEVYASFADALNSFKGLARTAKLDMEEWEDETQIEEQIDEEAQTASFEIYQARRRLHKTTRYNNNKETGGDLVMENLTHTTGQTGLCIK